MEHMPSLHNDDEAEEFVARADLSKYDLSGFKPMRFEIAPGGKDGSLKSSDRTI